MYICIRVCLCASASLQMKATEAITAVPEWFQPGSWADNKRLSLDLPKQEMGEWNKLVKRAEEIGKVP